MKLSIWPTAQQPMQDLLEVAVHADRTGWDGVYVWDHFMGDGAQFGAAATPTLECTSALAGITAVTSSVEVGPLVLSNTYRHPAVVANWAVTMDHLSGGRFVLGIGAGWQINEHEQYGIDLPPAGSRIERLEESCSIIRSMLDRPVTTVVGRHYRVVDAICEPKPVSEHLPLLIGGKGDRMLGVVARQADRWNMWGMPETIAERSAVLDERCGRIDRDPRTIERSAQVLVALTDDADEAARIVESTAPRATYAGPVGGFAALVRAWARVGVGEVIVPDMLLGRGAQRSEALDAIREAVAAGS